MTVRVRRDIQLSVCIVVTFGNSVGGEGLVCCAICTKWTDEQCAGILDDEEELFVCDCDTHDHFLYVLEQRCEGPIQKYNGHMSNVER